MNILNKMIRCQINSYLSFIKCFYYSKSNQQNYLSYENFSIKDNDISKGESLKLKISNYINQIKIAMAYNNNIFICFLVYNNSEKSIPACYINDYSTNELNQIDCKYDTGYGPGYRVFYFNETGDFMFISVTDLTTTLLSSFNNSVQLCRRQIFSKQYNLYSIIYINGYKMINYTNNFTNYNKCRNIYVLEEVPTIKISTQKELIYTTEIQQTYITYIINHPLITSIIDSTSNYLLNFTSDYNIINTYNNVDFKNENYITSYNTIQKTELIMIKSNLTYIKEVTNKSKEEIFNDIKNVLEDKKVGETYEIKGEDFTIVIKPTNSTSLPNTTHVEFDECEKIIREKYNISDSSIILFYKLKLKTIIKILYIIK